MSTPTNTPTNTPTSTPTSTPGDYVLACIDGASLSTAVCDYAAWIARTADAPLRLLHQLEQRPQAPIADLSGSIGLGAQEELLEELTGVEQQRSRLLMEKGKLMLAAARTRALEAGVAAPETIQRHGRLQETLVEWENDIRVLVMGVRGSEHGEGELGAHIESVIRSLHRPVLVVNTDFVAPRNIMLAYDGGEAARKALAMIAESPVLRGLHCHVVHVGADGQGDELLREACGLLAQAGVSHEGICLNGRLDDALCAYQGQHAIDLMVMGAFSHLRIRDLLLGSFTARMLVSTKRPLLLLR